jgi:hypothetical protein
MNWTFAKTYTKTAPHEWVVQEKAPAFFKRIAKRVKNNGIWEEFCMPGGKPYQVRYWYRGHYKYWIDQDVLNRTLVGRKYPKLLDKTGPLGQFSVVQNY